MYSTGIHLFKSGGMTDSGPTSKKYTQTDTQTDITNRKYKQGVH